ncbi:uncharacterized protein LOC131074913 isoform X2 [Cryptomeria japonica]|nr:uncharacterized protein LOC131074913 isoform X2 [Cryptomeria japonica]
MEKDLEMDEILNYRSIAESHLQIKDMSLKENGLHSESDGRDFAFDKHQNEEQVPVKPRGWLNWLSLGMLGAGGTTDSSQFAGVFSDDIIKDIYEATMYNPVSSSDIGIVSKGHGYLLSISIDAQKVIMKLNSMSKKATMICMTINGANMISNFWQDSANFCIIFKSMKVVDPITNHLPFPYVLSDKVDAESSGLTVSEACLGNSSVEFLKILIEILPKGSDTDLSVRVVIQPFEFIYNAILFGNIIDFLHMPTSFQSHLDLVLRSLNDFESIEARVLSKAEYIFSNRRRVSIEANCQNANFIFPWYHPNCGWSKMVFTVESMHFGSVLTERATMDKVELEKFFTRAKNLTLDSIFEEEDYLRMLQTFYDRLQIQLSGIQGKLERPKMLSDVCFIKSNASVTFDTCIMQDEPTMKQLKVHGDLSSIHIILSYSILKALKDMTINLSFKHVDSKSEHMEKFPEMKSNTCHHQIPEGSAFGTDNMCNSQSHIPLKTEMPASDMNKIVRFQLITQFKSALIELSFEDGGQNYQENLTLHSQIENLNIELAQGALGRSFRTGIETIKIDGHNLAGNPILSVLRMKKFKSPGSTNLQTDDNLDFNLSNAFGHKKVKGGSEGKCFYLLYFQKWQKDFLEPAIKIYLNNLVYEFHPMVFGRLHRFFSLISKELSSFVINTVENIPMQEVRKTERVGSKIKYPNSDMPSIRLGKFSDPLEHLFEHFPFVSFQHAGISEGPDKAGLTDPSSHIEYVSAFHKSGELEYTSAYTAFSRMNRTVNLGTTDVMDICADFDKTDSCGKYDFHVELEVNSSDIHFCDSSCILATVQICKSKTSIFLSEETGSFDLMGCFEDIKFSSPWAPSLYGDILWGPLVHRPYPILNIRLCKNVPITGYPKLELSVSIQHVRCILPSDFLAMIIGYFTSDWETKLENDGNLLERKEDSELESTEMHFLYKVEFVDSVIILPVETTCNESLEIILPQLFFSYLPSDTNPTDGGNMHNDCVSAPYYDALRLDSIDIAGSQLSMSFCSMNIGEQEMQRNDECHVNLDFPLIEGLDATLSMRIPCEAQGSCEPTVTPTSVVFNAQNFEANAEEESFLRALQAVNNVALELSFVGTKSRLFVASVAEFMESRSGFKQSNAGASEVSKETSIDIKCSISKFSLKLQRSRENCPAVSELIGKVDAEKIKVSCFLRNNSFDNFSMDMFSLHLVSAINSSALLQCFSTDSSHPCICIDICTLHIGQYGGSVSVPCTNIWVHLNAWNEIALFVSTCINSQARTRQDAPPQSSDVGFLDAGTFKDATQLHREMLDPNTIRSSGALHLKSETLNISFHIPDFSCEDDVTFPARNISNLHREDSSLRLDVIETNYVGPERQFYRFILLSLSVIFDELIVTDLDWMFKARIVQIEGKTEIIQKSSAYHLPFFHVTDIGLKGKISQKDLEPLKLVLDIQADKIDIWSSYPILCFWRNFNFGNSAKVSSTSLDFKLDVCIGVQKAAFLLSDGRWSCNAPIMEIFIRHISVRAIWNDGIMDTSLSLELQINYHNIHKVAWEPFLEPWNMQCQFVRKLGCDNLLSTTPAINIDVKSSSKLNLNLTEALMQASIRGSEIIKDAWGGTRCDDCPANNQNDEYSPLSNTHVRRYAPYFLQNDTGMPLNFWLIHGPIFSESNETLDGAVMSAVEPGFTVPLFVEETPEELFRRWKPNHSSERLADRKTSGTHHHMIRVQLEGTSKASIPMSMDLVGLRSFEVDFSKSSHNGKFSEERDSFTSMQEENANIIDSTSKFISPVVFEVSIQRYSKLVRLYSTVTLVNATSVSLEVRFDIPFGIAPKIMDPMLPGQELPLPVHLAETGRMRWRPLGSSYLWSEAQSLSNILSQENKLSLLRSFVCYPSHPSNGPFRCCISVQENTVPCYDGIKQCSFNVQDQSNGKHLNGSSLAGGTISPKKVNTSLIRQITVTAPLVIKNCLPVPLEFSIENGASIMEHIFVSEGDAVSVFDIDFVHELGIGFQVAGFSPLLVKFARAMVYTSELGMSNSLLEKIVSTETLILTSDSSKSPPVFVKAEKRVDPLCGSRELSLSVPFWIYNCSGLILELTDGDIDQKVGERVLYPSYSSIRQEEFTNKTSGIGIACVDSHRVVGVKDGRTFEEGMFCPNRHVPCKIGSHLPSRGLLLGPHRFFENNNVRFSGDSSFKGTHEWQRRGSNISFSDLSDVNVEVGDRETDQIPKVKACMHSPSKGLEVTEATLRLRMLQSISAENMTEGSIWSDAFSLNPPSGSSMVLIPQISSPGAFIMSVISTPVLGACAGKTMSITLQPRYVISNACSRDLLYKQRGTRSFQRLRIGEHLSLHWTNVKRELLVSIRFDEPGWDWSGSFLPDKLGDTQVKMRNYVTGALQMVRIEVQNASVAVGDVKGVNNSDGSLATYLVLLSDDDTGFMPYRIDNFSMERLRLYQQKCEKFENVLQPYTTCFYAWDEPCQPHRLTIEVPGKGALGSYGLDDVRDYTSVHLTETPEKSERRFFVSVHAEGPIKVLSVTDADTHTVENLNGKGLYRFAEKHTSDQNGENCTEFSAKITVCLPFIGLAMVDSIPQELAFACVRGIKLKILQGLHQQKFIFQVASFQIDNQLPHPIYPVMVSMDNTSIGAFVIQGKSKENTIDSMVEEDIHDLSHEPAFYLVAVKWQHMATSVNCFECVTVRFAPLRLEFEDQMIFRLVDFIKSVTWRFWRGTTQAQNFEMWPVKYGMSQVTDHFIDPQIVEFVKNPHSSQLHFLKVMKIMESYRSWPSPVAVRPIGAPWQNISLLARRRRKIYIENFHVAPIKLTVSFSSSPWLPKDDHRAAAQSLIWINSTTLQRGIMALMDVEGAPIYFRQLTLAHPLASWDAIQGMVVRHYSRQLLHEVYKVLGSVGVFGNPMGFARSLGFGIRDFISVPAKSIVQNPTGLVTSMAEGTKSLLNNTVFAVSNAATQFSKAARKGVAAFAFDEEFVEEMERRQQGQGYHNQGVLNEFLEGLTGLLQSPIRGAEKHGLPGILLGVVVGAAGFVARPVVSILDVSGRTAQSIRNRSNPRQLNHFRVRLPRPVIRDSPLRPYSWEEAVGTAMLQEVESSRLNDEVFLTCIALGPPGMFVVVTERLLLKVKNANLASETSSENTAPAGPEWEIYLEIAFSDVIHLNREGQLLNVLAGTPETYFKKTKDPKISKQNYRAHFFPFTRQSIELPNDDVAEELLHLLQSLLDELTEHPSLRIFRRHNLR